MAREAGLGEIRLEGKSGYIDGMVEWRDPLYAKIVAHLPAGAKPSDYVTSLEVTARKTTQRVDIYDPAMCCSTGVCGPQVDPVLVRVAADVKWLQERGVEVRRFNLSQNPAAYVENELVKGALTEKGESALPLVLLGGQVFTSGHYPERTTLANALGLNGSGASLFTPAVKELVAIGAAIAANCEPCLKYHYRQAQLLAASKEDMANAVKTAFEVKDSPHQSILRLANRLTGAGLITREAAGDPCCGDTAARNSESAGPCCPPKP
jgi:AhpD family alkylhydroperoxidase